MKKLMPKLMPSPTESINLNGWIYRTQLNTGCGGPNPPEIHLWVTDAPTGSVFNDNPTIGNVLPMRDARNEFQRCNVFTPVGYQVKDRIFYLIENILRAAEARDWEGLVGKFIRIKVSTATEGSPKIQAIGHIVNALWIDAA